MGQSGRGRSGWIGWLIFVFFVFGGRFLPPLANWLSQITGLTITPPMLIVAVIVLAVVGSLLGSVARQAGRLRGSNDTRLPLPPTLPPPTSMSSPRPGQTTRTASPPSPIRLPTASSDRLPQSRLPTGDPKLPSPPRFEPIIDPRVLTFGVLGMLVFGLFLLVLFAIAGALP